MRRVQSNPAWSDRIAMKYCDQIREAARKNDLPEPLLNEHCAISGELGSGSYGAVYGTNSEDCTFKITTDATEAHFCALAIKLRKEKGVDPQGIVDIRAVFALPEKHEGYPVFILWRERAVSMGLHNGDECQDVEDIEEFDGRLSAFYEMAESVYDIASKRLSSSAEGEYWTWMRNEVDVANAILDNKRPRATTAFSEKLSQCWDLASDLEDLDISRDVGKTLKVYLDQGILMADIHGGNVGIVERGKCAKRTWCVVDPGHCMILKHDLAQVKIQLLK